MDINTIDISFKKESQDRMNAVYNDNKTHINKICDTTVSLNDTISIPIVSSNLFSAFCSKKHAPELDTISYEENHVVVVRWKDHTVTVVKCSEADSPDIYSAFCAALAKKIYGTTSAVYREIDKHNVETINRKKEEEKAKQRKEIAEREKINHNKKIRRIAKRLQNENEAWDYLSQKKKSKGND